jgi:predicted GNAT family N-acyltransferase
MTAYRVRRLSGTANLDPAFAVRRRVFIDEQDVPEAVEMDGNDDTATHFVAYDGTRDEPVGTARVRILGDTGKAERVAVLPEYRGEGLGTRLMEHLEDEAREQGCSQMRLHAQTHVEAFYIKLGYETVSDVFEEADIPHVEMVKGL